MTINKQALLEKIRAKITEEAESLTRGAQLAHQDATNAESKAENKYDTRGLEASYLAEAQTKLALETRHTVAIYNDLALREFRSGDKIALTALVELERDEKRALYFIGPKGGGITIEHDGHTITLITPTSPLGSILIGKEEGDFFEMKTAHAVHEYDVISVR